MEEDPKTTLWSLDEVPGWESFQIDTSDFTPKSYLYDAARFSHKVYAMLDAFESGHRYVIWLDADIVYKKRFGQAFFKSLLDDTMCAFLGRGGVYTETGCLVFDTKHPDFTVFKQRFSSFYNGRLIFLLDAWIDCTAFDQSRFGLECVDLTPNAEGMCDVFSQSPLDEVMTHNKGQGMARYS